MNPNFHSPWVALLWLLLSAAAPLHSLGALPKILRNNNNAGVEDRQTSDAERAELTAKLQSGAKLTGREKKRVAALERERYIELRKQGIDEVSNTEDAIALRSYRLRGKKHKGIIRRRPASLSQVLFPGVAPVEYEVNSPIWILADLVESRKTQLPFEYYDIPTACAEPSLSQALIKKEFKRKNLGSRLQGHEMKPAPFDVHVLQDQPCTILCIKDLSMQHVRWLRRLVERLYRVQLQLDSLPVLMRSKELNYAARGYPVGFKAPSTGPGAGGPAGKEELYLYNHLKFTITYHEDPSSFEGIRITGFDVHPVSYNHGNTESQSCNPSVKNLDNDPEYYLPLRLDTDTNGSANLRVVTSYEIEWLPNSLEWTDRWDVYLVGSPDDDIHYLSIVNSLMIVIFLTGAISTIMIRTLRKDIAGYNNQSNVTGANDMAAQQMMLDDVQDETGWKLVHGDVFRPPSTNPILLSVFVGTGSQLGSSFFFTLVCTMMGLLNPLKKGQTLTAILFLYVLSGSINGYVSARICKYCGSCSSPVTNKNSTNNNSSQTSLLLKNWKRNTILSATLLPGLLVSMFIILNIFLSYVGAATAVSFFTIVKLFLLWVCVSTPLVFVGSVVGYKQEPISVPVKIKQIPRVIPEVPIHVHPYISILLGGILPFGSVCIELAFIMSALWLHQYYYVMGFLLAVCLILVMTCAQVSVVLCYLQLCAEDYNWWWTSFFNCATAGLYLFLYSLWFLSSRMDLVGTLPVVIYLTYMSMISICFSLCCGSISFFSSFVFCRTIYSAVKVD